MRQPLRRLLQSEQDSGHQVDRRVLSISAAVSAERVDLTTANQQRHRTLNVDSHSARGSDCKGGAFLDTIHVIVRSLCSKGNRLRGIATCSEN